MGAKAKGVARLPSREIFDFVVVNGEPVVADNIVAVSGEFFMVEVVGAKEKYVVTIPNVRKLPRGG
jgi:hypothetical protein